MKTRLRQVDKSLSTQGFTLVELLIAISIMVILASLAIPAFRAAESDRVVEATSTVKYAIERAKANAMRAQADRGLRLMLAQQVDAVDSEVVLDRCVVTSLVFTDGGETISNSTGQLEFDSRDTGPALSRGRWRLTSLDDETLTDWHIYLTNQLIIRGSSIEYPANSGCFYEIESVITGGKLVPNGEGVLDPLSYASQSQPAKGFTLRPRVRFPQLPETYSYTSIQDVNGLLEGHSIFSSVRGHDPVNPDPNDISGDAGIPGSIRSATNDFTIRLEPRILAGTQPVALPRGTCINLIGSKIPLRWRPIQQVFNTDGSQADVCVGGYGGIQSEIAGQLRHMRYLDLTFTSNGNLGRSLAADGMLHFHIVSYNDLLAAGTGQLLEINGDPATGPRTDNPYALPSNSLQLPNDASVLFNPKNGSRFITLATNTGTIYSTDYQPSRETPPNRYVVLVRSAIPITTDNPFYKAINALESRE